MFYGISSVFTLCIQMPPRSALLFILSKSKTVKSLLWTGVGGWGGGDRCNRLTHFTELAGLVSKLY